MNDAFSMYFMLTITGLVFGSFFGSVIYRLPRQLSLLRPRSHCPNCEHRLAWRELIPVVSYVVQRGKCTSCGRSIPIGYPIIEVLSAAIMLVSFTRWGFTAQFLSATIFFWLMILIAVVDWKHFIIPNSLVVAGIFFAIVSCVFTETEEIVTTSEAGAFALVVVGLIRLGGTALFKREAMGMGDVKLCGMLGLWLGIAGFAFAFWIAALIGSIYGIAQKVARLKQNQFAPEPFVAATHVAGGFSVSRESRIPFGAFLALSSSIVFFFLPDLHRLLEGVWTSIQ